MLVTIILDGVGVGRAPDAADYGDEGANTLACVSASGRLAIPNLERLGIGHLGAFPGIARAASPGASFGVMEAVAAGKDSTSGHWELAGLILDQPFPTYPVGFPDDVVTAFLSATGCERVLANKPASGTAVIEEFGREHLATGLPILYTSADSVFQVATHVEVVPLETLYRWCAMARDEICVGEHAVGRVIARPFTGRPGAFVRLSDARRDYSLPPPSTTVQDQLQGEGVETVAVGKIGDLFANVGFDRVLKTKTNAEGIDITLRTIHEAHPRMFVWTNLVDFDQLFGHRNDVQGFARALEEFDRAIPDLLAALPPGGRMIITADHGNDPCYPGTDHTRERVPLLVIDQARSSGEALGVRSTFADHAASVAAHFGIAYDGPGDAFVPRGVTS